MSALNGWVHEAEFLAIVQRCCDNQGMSVRDFDKVVAMGRDTPADPRFVEEITALIEIMKQSLVGAHGVPS
jgi:hypothetical protein